MSLENGIKGLHDLDHAAYLDKYKVAATHEDVPSLASPIDGETMGLVEMRNASVGYHVSGNDNLAYNNLPNQMDGDPVPLSRTSNGESSAK